jgi:hypothetical protein
MNGELWVPGKPSFTKPYCSKQGSAAMDPIFPSCSWGSDGETEQTTKQTKCNQTVAILGVLGNTVLLRLRKVIATRRLNADHSLTVKATKPNIQQNIKR